MRILIFSLTLFVLLTGIANSQSEGLEKLNLMQNSLTLGLEEKGLEIGSHLISEAKYLNVKEDALFMVSEYFFQKGMTLGTAESIDLIKAYTFYLKLKNEIPLTNYISMVEKRIRFLENNYQTLVRFRDLNDNIENERAIVSNKLDAVQGFVDINQEYEYGFYQGGGETKMFYFLLRYYDEIINAHPDFAIYAEYKKLLLALSVSREVNIIQARQDDETLSRKIDPEVNQMYKVPIYKVLKSMEEKYPAHPLTIKAHCVAATHMLEANAIKENSIELKELLEYVVNNDEDKLSYRYLLSKEYLGRTKFK